MHKLFLIFIYLTGNAIFSIEPVILSDTKGEYPLGMSMEILEDKEGKLTLDDIQKPEYKERWVRSNVEVPNFGYTKNKYWIRFVVRNLSQKKYYLEIRYPNLDKIDFFTTEDGKNISHKKTGDLSPFSERDLKFRNFVFLIHPVSNNLTGYYLRIESESSMQIPLVIWSPDAFAEKKLTETLGLGIFYGVMFVMAIYNFFIWLSTRDRSYLTYVIFILVSALFLFTYQGFAYQYLWSGSPALYNMLYLSLLYLVILSGCAFTAQFLILEKNLPGSYLIYRILFFILCIFVVAVLFINYRIAISFVSVLVSISSLWMVGSSIVMVTRKFRPAIFYLFAWSLLILGGTVLALKNGGFLPINFFTEYAFQVGSAFQVILLSLGLADRINDLQKQYEIAREKTLEAERRSGKVKDEFLSNLSHELKTPLSIVYAYSEMLTTVGNNPEKVIKYSREIYGNAQKLNDYVSDLILISEIESNLELQKSAVNMDEFIPMMTQQFKLFAEAREIKIKINAGENIKFNCDPILLEKALSAILKNAIVYNKKNGNVNIDVHKSGEKTMIPQLEIRIKDSGIGIAEEFTEKIFEKFFRIDSALTYEISGVGIGLFIARRIVELHGGRIEVESETGKGTEFVINLPFQ